MYFSKTPRLLHKLFPSIIWKLPRKEKTVYLTFDDGPTSENTAWILEELYKHKAKATFFCLGNQITQLPQLFEIIKAQGHALGNHSYSHLSGWKTATTAYVQDVTQAQQFFPGTLFRPPYGKLSWRQYQKLKEDYKIVMWDIMAGDFDEGISSEKCYANVIDQVENGSIIVFHDNVKARPHLQIVLPKVLIYLSEKGYKMEAITA